jgi:hypothetical protein
MEVCTDLAVFVDNATDKKVSYVNERDILETLCDFGIEGQLKGLLIQPPAKLRFLIVFRLLNDESQEFFACIESKDSRLYLNEFGFPIVVLNEIRYKNLEVFSTNETTESLYPVNLLTVILIVTYKLWA